MASDRGASQQTCDFGDEEEPTLPANLLRPEFTDPASVDTPSLNASAEMDLMELIVHRYTLVRAWAQVKRNRGAPGPDGMTIQEFEGWCRAHWPAVKQQLLNGTYRPSPVRRKTIPKEGGGERQLGIPNVLDRLIQQAICQVLTPIFDPGFSESSFGFRPGRSAHGAAVPDLYLALHRPPVCEQVANREGAIQANGRGYKICPTADRVHHKLKWSASSPACPARGSMISALAVIVHASIPRDPAFGTRVSNLRFISTVVAMRAPGMLA